MLHIVIPLLTRSFNYSYVDNNIIINDCLLNSKRKILRDNKQKPGVYK